MGSSLSTTPTPSNLPVVNCEVSEWGGWSSECYQTPGDNSLCSAVGVAYRWVRSGVLWGVPVGGL